MFKLGKCGRYWLDFQVGRYFVSFTLWQTQEQWLRTWVGRYKNLRKNVFEFGPVRIIQCV